MPEHIVTVKKERERASNALVKTDKLPRIQIPGNTKKTGTTYRQATQVSKSQKGSIPEHMSPESKDLDFNTR
jgi:hypothetical protein